MNIHMTSGKIYNIPKNVRYVNSTIAISNDEYQYCKVENMNEINRDIMFEKNKEIFKQFIYIGYEKIYNKDMYIEKYWFIDIRDLNKCTSNLVV